ncbi:MAG: hypothetical protein JW841_08355 [Deltaproteobacteria bacterium]|nr:hypothetical protein [Deltaproteobacteria bacterium]
MNFFRYNFNSVRDDVLSKVPLTASQIGVFFTASVKKLQHEFGVSN